jgi:hypothetical protein
LQRTPYLKNPSRARFDFGVWHCEQVGPALPVYFSFSFIVEISATDPYDTGDFQVTNFLTDPFEISPGHVFRGFFSKLAPQMQPTPCPTCQIVEKPVQTAPP